MDDGHAASVAAEHLSELQADVATAKDKQVFGKCGELHDRFVGEKGHVT